MVFGGQYEYAKIKIAKYHENWKTAKISAFTVYFAITVVYCTIQDSEYIGPGYRKALLTPKTTNQHWSLLVKSGNLLSSRN